MSESKIIKTFEIKIVGIVQGVGFRPFLFNLAKFFNLNGYILNRGNAGVRLVLQGKQMDIDSFVLQIKQKSPPIAFIEDIEVNVIEEKTRFKNLRIEKSETGRGFSLTLPPDIALCEECLKDMRDSKKQKYYMYPFTACASCGPRFTTVTSLPYDRERTTMIEFPYCNSGNPSCIKEFSDFQNRRFHAQTFACSVCGPNYNLYDKDRKKIEKGSIKEVLLETSKRINDGEIAAIKGIGGVHLVCLAEDNDVILKLRKRKGKRQYKPFALMIPNLKLIENDYKISNKEREILESFRRPIVLLERKSVNKNTYISEFIAPGLNNIGFMLPYSGIHYLLFDFVGEKPLVYTSGNASNIPMGIDNDKIFDQLNDLADFFLLHNRKIHQRADDSVIRLHNEKIKLIRRSRGYIPEYIPLPFKVEVPGALATGPELSSTGAVLRFNRIFPTQHIGNVRHLETYDFLKEAIFHMKTLLQIDDSEIKFIACDAHPAFVSSKFAEELSSKFQVRRYPIQHHFAHLLGLMAENKVSLGEEIVGISTDGVGYGDDKNVWGGEIMVCSYNGYKRYGHLEYQPMLGGDRCTKYPARMVASILLKALGIENSLRIFERMDFAKDLEYKDTELKTIISQYKNDNYNFPNENIPLTSSTGRIFDAVSYLVGACNIKTYGGEPAMRLEGFAANGNPNNVNLNIEYDKKHSVYQINTSKLISDIIDLLLKKENKREDIAAKFEIELGKSFAEVAIEIAKELGIYKIGLTGGVAYNYSFSKVIKETILKEKIQFLEHEIVPSGDAGISTGQLIGALFQFLNS